MSIPTAEQLETTFLQAGQIRKNNPKYSNDSTYWEGGHCNWGGNHNLKEDCQQLAKGFGKLESLDKVSGDLNKCTSKQEFEAKKRIQLNNCDELVSKLSNKTASSCMFGICIIWGDDNMSGEVQRFVEQAKRGVTNFKSALNNMNYSNVEEIRQLDLEIDKIKDRMEKNKQKAMSSDTSPEEKIALLKEIEKDGKLLEQKVIKKIQIENIINFNASKYVNDFVGAMKRAIEGKDDRTGINSDKEWRNTNDQSSHNTSDTNAHRTSERPNTSDYNNFDNSNTNSFSESSSTNIPQNNQSLLILVGIATILILFLLNKEENQYDYWY